MERRQTAKPLCWPLRGLALPWRIEFGWIPDVRCEQPVVTGGATPPRTFARDRTGFPGGFGPHCGRLHSVQLRMAVAAAFVPCRLSRRCGRGPSRPPHQPWKTPPDDRHRARDRRRGRDRRGAADGGRRPVPAGGALSPDRRRTSLGFSCDHCDRGSDRRVARHACRAGDDICSCRTGSTRGVEAARRPHRARSDGWCPPGVCHADGETDSRGRGLDRRDREPGRAADGPLEGHGARVRRHRPAFRCEPGDTGDSRDRQRSGLVVGRRTPQPRSNRPAPGDRARSKQPGYVSVRPVLDGVARDPAP